MKNKYLLVFCLFFASYFAANAQSGKDLFNDSIVHEIRWTFQESDFWGILRDNYQGSINDEGVPTNTPYLLGSISIDGEVIDSVGLRQKGFSSYFASNDLKKSLKVDLNEFVSGTNYDGIKKFNLANGVGDPAYQRDVIAFDVMRKAGIRAPRTAHAKVYINNRYWGLYAMIEQVDKTFLDNNFADGSGNLYKNIGWSTLDYKGTNPNAYAEEIGLRTNEDVADWSGFIEFMQVLNQTPQSNFKEEIEKIFNVDYYLRVLAVDVMTNNWDSYIEHGRNFYLYHEPSSGQFFWIPWDYNLSMGGDFSNGGGPGDDGPPSDPPNCPTILSGESPHSADDSLFIATINVLPFCCYAEWDGFCDEIYNHIASIDDCNSIQNGTSPYPSSDSIFQQVTFFAPECCSGDWTTACQDFYDEIAQEDAGGLGFNDFNLNFDNPEKVLIRKILAVPEYRERYYNYACHILDDNFTIDRLAPMIDATSTLIQDAAEDDQNSNFPFDDFLYDISEGIDSSKRSIPSLKQFIGHRIPLLEQELIDLNHNCSASLAAIGWRDVVINEFVASNDSTSGIFDQDGESDDWIELHNNTDEWVDLTDFFLSDNYGNPLKWAFPAGTRIGPKGYKIVWADENGMEEGLHANFKLSKGGESIMLVHSDGTFIDSLSYGQQETNVPSARVPNGTGDFVQQDQTFRSNNDWPSSVAELPSSIFKIFPNPADDLLNIEFEEGTVFKNAELNLRNMLGQTMIIQTIDHARRTQINVAGLISGMYFVEVKIGEARKVVKLFVE